MTTGASPLRWRADAAALRALRLTPARAGVGQLVQAPDGSIVAANADAQRILGLGRDELLAARALPLRGLGRDGRPLPADAIPDVAALRTGAAHPDVLVGVAVGHRGGAETRWLTVTSTPLADGDDVVAAVHVFRDVSAGAAARDAVERALALLHDVGTADSEVDPLAVAADPSAGTPPSLHEYRLLADAVGDAVLRTDAHWRLTYVSDSVTDLLGWTPAALHGRGLADLLDPDDLLDILRRRATDGAAGRYDIAMRTADGGRRWVRMVLQEVRGAGGTGAGLVASLCDIDEQRRRDEDRDDALTRYRRLLEHTPDVLFEADEGRRVTWVSAAVEALLGRPAADVVGATLSSLVHPEDRTRVDDVLHPLTTPVPLELRVVDAAGEPRWVEMRARAWHDGSTGTRYAGSWRDMHREVEARAALVASESRFRVVVENVSDVLCQCDPQHRLLWMSPSVTDLLGWEPSDLLGRRSLELVHPEDVGDLRSLLDDDALAEVRGEARMRTKSDGWRWIGITLRRLCDAEGRTTRHVGSWRDLTAEIAVRERLRAAEEAYRTIADNASDVVYRTDARGVLTWVSSSVTPALGWAPEHLLGRPSTEFVHPDDVPALLAADEAAAASAQPARLEIRLRRADGGHTWVALTARPTYDDRGAVAARIGSGHVVDAEVEARQALADANDQLALVLGQFRDVLYDVAPDGVVQWVSPSVTEVFGWRPEEVVGQRFGLGTAEEQAAWGAFLATSPVTRRSSRRRFEAVRADGERRWVEANATLVRDDAGRLERVVAAVRDVDTDVVAERALAESERRYRLLAQHASDVVVLCDADGRARWVSPSVVDLLGRAPEDVVRAPLSRLTHPDDAAVLDLAEHELAEGGESRVELRLRTRSGSYRWVEWAVRVVPPGADGQGARVARWRDVDEAVRLREELEASRARFRDVAEHAADVMFHGSNEGVFTWVSQSVTSVLGWRPEELLGMTSDVFVHPGDMPALAAGRAALLRAEDARMRLRFRTRDGAYRPMDVLVRPVFDATGTVSGRVGSCRLAADITLP